MKHSSSEFTLKMNEYVRSEQMLDHLINARPTLTQETCDSQSHHRQPVSESKLEEPADGKAELKVLRDKLDQLVDCEQSYAMNNTQERFRNSQK